MNYWHEPRKKERTTLIKWSTGLKVQACLAYPDAENPKFQVFGKYWQKESEPLPGHIAPEGWIELWPLEPSTADSFADGARLLQQLFDQLQVHINLDEFEQRLPQRERIQVLTHTSQEYQAWIFKHQNSRYEVQYYSWTNGRGGGWIPVRYDTCTFTLKIEHAREIAYIEMEQLHQ